MRPLYVTALVTAATWEAWRWYLARVTAAPDEAPTRLLHPAADCFTPSRRCPPAEAPTATS
jgi:hypothetical protein